jgi:hypothetical protein
MKYMLLLSIVLIGCNVKNIEIEKDLSDRIKAANNAFQIAESEVFKDDVNPVDPDENLKPDPDADKCACKGTGKIVHGDGHSTPCPFHAVEVILQSH